MDRAEELRLLDRALARVRNKDLALTDVDTRVGLDRYQSPSWYEAEVERIFKRLPSMLVHRSELPGPGSFVTQEHLGRPLLVSRDRDGTAHAFFNVCRHRGTRLEKEPSGQRRHFTCGYHAWKYGTDGALVNVPSEQCFPSLVKSERNLVELPVVEAYGFVWLMPEEAPTAADLDRFLGGLRDDFAGLGLEAYELYGAESHVWEFNWKLFVEGTIEGYHFPFLHPKTANPLFENGVFFFDAFGPHLRSVLPKRSINFVARTDPAERSLHSVANVIHTVFPNETVLHQSDHFLWMTAHPLGPTTTLVKLRLIVPEGSVSAETDGRWEENRELTYQVQYEDLEIYREIQLGMASGANKEHCFGTQEYALQKFNESVETHLFGGGGT